MKKEITVKELKELLNKYNDSDIVKLEAYFSEWGEAELYIGEDEDLILKVKW